MNSMSHTSHEAINILEAGIVGGHEYPPQSATAQVPQVVSDFVDGSGNIFSMYLGMATEEDNKMAENWKADAEGVLIFTGLFSAAVASLISVSIQDIRQNPQDTSNFYLANIYQVLADPSRTNISDSLPTSPPAFSPPTYAVFVNALWFLSLVISVTCALLATLLQQWVRRYLKVTQSRYSLHKRARIRTFLSEGVERRLLPLVVETLPTLLHISLFLFFAGLVVFLWNVDLTIFKLVLSWVSVCTVLYGCFTVMPIICHDSPYLTPLSLPVWYLVIGIKLLLLGFFKIWLIPFIFFDFASNAYIYIEGLIQTYLKWLRQGMQKTVEETALISPSKIDAHAFLWTFDSLDEDHELERFFFGLPGFRSSKVVEDPLPSLAEEGKHRLSRALIGLLDRTISSDLLPEDVKNRRVIICKKAIDPAHIQFDPLLDLFSQHQYGGPLVAEIVQIMAGQGHSWYDHTTLNTQAIISMIAATVQPRDDPWYILASRSLHAPQADLRNYAAYGDSLSLAILIEVTRQYFSHFSKSSWPYTFSMVLEVALEFNVQDTLPELQHEFCALWNQIVRKVQDDSDQWMGLQVLAPIRNVYLALHQGTDSAPTRFPASTTGLDTVLWEPSSYPVCNIPGHQSDSTPHIHPHSHSTTFTPAVPHDYDNTATAPSIFASSPDTPSLSAHAPLRVDESLGDALPLDNNVSIPVSLDPIDQATTESRRIPATSPNLGSTRATHGRIYTSARTTHLSVPEPSAFASAPKSNLKDSPPDAVAVERTADTCAPSDGLDILSSASATPVLDDIPPSESFSPMLAPAAPFASPPPSISAPDLGCAEDEGNPTAGLRNDRDVLHRSFTIREDIMANPKLPPRSSLPSSVTGVPIASPSGRRSLEARHKGDHPPQPLHGQDDIV